MASPDVSPYVDPTIYDQQPSDIYDASVAYARAALPEWTPTVGSIEDALLQAASGVSGELLGALNRTTSSITEAVLQMFEIERLAGARPTAVLELALSDEDGHTLKKGTRFGWLDAGGTDSILYVFESTEDVFVGKLNTSMTVPVQGILNERYPVLEAGTFIRVLSAIPWIDTAILDEDLNAGSDPETDAEYFARAIGKLSSYSQALVLPKQFEQYLLAQYPDVYRVKAYSRLAVVGKYNDLPRTDLIAETLPANGYLTIYACGLNGASFSVEKSRAMASDLMQRAVAGLQIDIVPPHLVPIDVNVTIICSAGYPTRVVTDSVNAALSKYLTPNYWSWGDTIFYNEVVTAINNVAGVARVEDLSIVVSTTNHIVGIAPEDITGDYVTDGGAWPVGSLDVSGADLAFTRYGSLPDATISVTARAAR
jgi:hypothetical protein